MKEVADETRYKDELYKQLVREMDGWMDGHVIFFCFRSESLSV